VRKAALLILPSLTRPWEAGAPCRRIKRTLKRRCQAPPNRRSGAAPGKLVIWTKTVHP
jgi:hypothetical protein